jgi:hypothetical protein
MQAVTIPLAAIIVPIVIIALFTIVCIVYSIILIRRHYHTKRPDEHRESDEVSLDHFPSQNDFYPGIGVIGKERTIRQFMRHRGQGEGRSQSDKWGPYQIMFNPSPRGKGVHAAVFLDDVDLSTRLAWLLTKKPVALVGTDPVHKHWWASNWVMCLADPFDQLLGRIYNGNAVPELRL